MLSANCQVPISTAILVLAELFILLCVDGARNPVLMERRSAVVGI
jgi:hypothetical protein